MAAALAVFGFERSLHAEATAAQKVAAEALFDDGLKLMKSGRFSEACPKLEESQRADPGVGTLLYLAECYENLGRTASAWATFREAASRAGAEGQSERQKSATERAARLEPKLAYLTVQVAAETRSLQGLSVKLNQTSLGSEIFGVATPVDPGESRLEVAAPGHASFSAALSIEPSGRYTLSIPALAQQAATAPSAPSVDGAPGPSTENSGALSVTSAAPPPAADRASPALHTTGLILGGVGVVGLGLGSYFGLRAISKHDDATSGTCKSGVCQERADYDSATSARDAATLSNVFFGVGGVALVSGAALFFLFPSTRQQGTQIVPYATARAVGVSVGGSL